MKPLAFLIFSAFIALFIACGGESTIAPAEPPQSIEISPADASVALGYSSAFTATGIYAEGSKRDLTDDVRWESNDTAIAAFPPSGVQKGSADTLGKGRAIITARDGNISGTATLTVTDAELSSIEINPQNASVPTGLTENYTATGIFSDDSIQDLTTQVTWTSSKPDVAAVEPDGSVSAIADGSTIITASSGTVSATATLEVYTATLESIALVPTASSIALGNEQQFTATGTFSDSSTADITAEALWESSDTDVSTISNATATEGKAESTGIGTTQITATLNEINNSTTLEVTAATLESVALTPPMPSVVEGASVGFTATGTFSDGSTVDITASVIWGSFDTGVATISNASGSEGIATSVAAGTTLITAVSGAISAETMLSVTQNVLQSISVAPENQTVLLSGTSVKYTATGHYADGTQKDLTKLVTWSSSNTDVATVSNAGANSGTAVTHGSGTTTISAEYEGMTGTATLQVLL
jgi:hypothetical protein